MTDPLFTFGEADFSTRDLDALGMLLASIGRKMAEREKALEDAITSGATVTTIEKYRDLVGRLGGFREARVIIQDGFEQLMRNIDAQ